jgi:hypothetical protein
VRIGRFAEMADFQRNVKISNLPIHPRRASEDLEFAIELAG